MKRNKVIKLFFQLLAGIFTFLPLASTDAKLNDEAKTPPVIEEAKAPSDLTIHFEPGQSDGDAISIHFGPGPSGAIAIHFGTSDAKVIHFGPGPSALKSLHFGPGPSATKEIHFGSGPSAARTVSIHFGPGPASNSAIAENEVNQNKENLEKLE